MPALVEALTDFDAGVRRRASVALSELRHGNYSVQHLLRPALEDPREIVRRQVAEVLGTGESNLFAA